MKKTNNPVLVLTGLAVAAVAVVAGLTRDQWLNKAPVVTAELTAKAPETAVPAEPPVTPAEPATAPAEPQQPKAVEASPEAAPAASEQPKPAEAPAAAAPAASQQPKIAEAAPEPAPAAASDQPEPAQPVAEAPSQAHVPAFDTVRVEKTGEAVIAGTAEPGSEVVVKFNGKEIAKTTANSGGAFVAVPEQPLPAGVGAISIEAQGKGEAAPTVSEQTVAVVVPENAKQETLVAVVSPSAPTKVLQKPAAEPPAEQRVATAQPGPAAEQTEQQQATAEPAPAVPSTPKPAAADSKQVTLDAVDYDAAGNIVFSGRGQPGDGARIYVDNAHTGDAVVGGDGSWAFAGTAAISGGVHQLRVDGIDASGKVLNRVEVPFYREEQTKVASAAAPDQTAAEPAEVEVPPATTAAEAGAEVAAAATAALQPPKDGRVVIQPGNNLWRISRVLYGTGTKFTVIYEANKDQIRDPDLIYPGQVFMTPEVVPPSESIDPKRHEPLSPEETSTRVQ